MKARILDPQVKIYSAMDENAVSVATLTKGTEVEIGSARRKNGKLWVPVTLNTGQKVFMLGEARIFSIREGSLMQAKVDVRSEASGESAVVQQLARNARFAILEVMKESQEQWVRIRDANGSEGYIPGDTRIRVTPQKTKAQARKNILSGVMWLVIGGIITFSGSAAVSGGGFTVLGYGALFFGLVMMISGIVQYFTSPA